MPKLVRRLTAMPSKNMFFSIIMSITTIVYDLWQLYDLQNQLEHGFHIYGE